MDKSRIRRGLLWLDLLVSAAVLLALGWVLVRASVLGQSGLPSTHAEQRRMSLALLTSLRHALHEQDAARRMQELFPEGACFLLTLYGLAWANLAEAAPEAPESLAARAELAWATREQAKPYVTASFSRTQVHHGVFWMGQHNLLLGRLMALLPPAQRPPDLEQTFHQQSRQLSEAFLARPIHHLDSYPEQCWPADSVAALVSLRAHDRLYGTDFGQAYEAWKAWTLAHLDPATELPPGRLDGEDGAPGEPPRGCANSWILGLLGPEDPALAGRLYAAYRRHFAIRRLGFEMLREVPAGVDFHPDVDSGPIIWGAGVAATGIGLAAARACGDLRLAGDIHSLAGALGLPRWTHIEGQTARNYLFGRFPMGDAFLAWGYSVPEPARPVREANGDPWRRLGERLPFQLVMMALFGVLAVRAFFVVRKLLRRLGLLKPPAAPRHDPSPES